MFTGIVRERGRVVAAERNGGSVHLRIEAPETAQASPGDSISVSGCCLTVTTTGEACASAVASRSTNEPAMSP